MSDERDTQAETEEQEEAHGTTSSGRAPPPYPSQRVRTHRSTQPETPYARVSPPPPANAYHERVPEVPPPAPASSNNSEDDWSVITQPRIMSPLPASRPPARSKPPLAPLAPLPRPSAVPRPSSAPRSRPSPAPTARSSTPAGAPSQAGPPPKPPLSQQPAASPPPAAVPPPKPPLSQQPAASPPPPPAVLPPVSPLPPAAPAPAAVSSSASEPPAARAPSSPPADEPDADLAAHEQTEPEPPAEPGSVDVEIDPDWQSEPPTPPAAAAAPPAPLAEPEPEAKPAGPPVQITAMRIIAIGAPTRVEEPIPVASDEIEVTEQLDEPDPLLAALTAEPPAEAEDSDDLLEEEVAAEAPPAPVPSGPPQVARADAKPPPPPRRALVSAPAVDAEKERLQAAERARKAAEEAAKKQRRAWWEVLFNEDFNRASARLSDDQIVREVNFIEESLGVATSGVVLDLGCGAGYHAVELAGRGYGVVGYDLSLFQLALAAEVAQERGTKLNLLQGDMREMAFEEMFDGIFCWNTSFGYFEEEKNVNVAQRIFRALRPGGMFLLDVANRDFVAMNQPSSVWYEGDSCVCMDDMQMDFISSRMRVKRSLILDDGRTRECVYSIRLYTLHELGKLLHDVGFKVTEASGHPATPGVFFGQHSPRIIMLAERP